MDRKIYHNLVTPEEALEIVFKNVKVEPLGVETVDLLNAYGRVLAEDIYSKIDVPPFDRATMDGYAVHAEDTFTADELNPLKLKVVGKVEVGQEYLPSINKGECVEIATGAPLPKSANAVLMVEYTKALNDEILIYKSVAPGENVASAGSDISLGDLVLRKGTLLACREIAVLASIGIDKVKVYKRPRVAIISTGNELETPGEKLRFGKIYDANTYSIAAAVRELNAEPIVLGIARDIEEEIYNKIINGLEKSDLVIISGGTSAGTSDITYRVLELFGPPGIVVHGLKVKPGKPTVIAISKDKKIIVGLPGYPNSALMVFNLIVKPIIERMNGIESKDITIKAKIAQKLHGEKGRRALIPVSLVESSGYIKAYPLPAESGQVNALAQADGYIEVPEDVEFVDEGEEVTVKLFSKNYTPANMYIIGSHDIGLDIIIVKLSGKFNCKVINVGSLGGLLAIISGDADIAGIHLVDEETGIYNIPYIKRLDIHDAVLIRGYMRRQGIIVPKGNPKNIKSIEDFLRSDVTIVNRNRGAGTRALLDLKLKEIAKKSNLSFEEIIKKVKGYFYEVKTHTAVAAAIAQGKADAGLGIESAAAMYNLDFIPLTWEYYDFLIMKSSLNKDAVKKFLEILKSKEFKVELEKIPGYKVPENIGEVIWSD